MFNNKFSRILPHPGYNVGGGIGEAALLGAAFGGGKALITGENVLEGALLGGATGAVTGGVFGGAGGTAANEVQNQVADTALNTTVEGLTNTAADQVANSSLNMLNPYAAEIGGANLTSALPQATQLTNQGITGLGGMQAIPQAAEQAVQTANAGLTGLNAPVGQGGLSVGNTGAVGNAGIAASGAPTSTMDFLSQPGIDLRQYTSPDTMAGKGLDWWADQGTAGRAMYAGLGGAAVGAMEPLPLPEEPEKQKSKLAGFDAQRFTPYMPAQPDPYYSAQYAAQGGVMNSYAQGGIAALADDNGYPMGRQVNTQFATPSQMPTSSAVINADYDAATDPYTGSPIGMANGGVARFFGGGNTNGQVYYDSDKGQYYTMKQGLFNPVMGFNSEREYIGANPAGAGSMDNFQVSQATPVVYQQQQYDPVQVAQVASNPAVQQQVLGGAQNYSLADSLPLLQATNPGIASLYAPPSAPSAPSTPVEEKAQGGIAGYSLGGYAAGGNPRLLKGPGDGMSDNIPATIGGRQPARLADGEFVVPADVVSHLGNGSTDAGAKHLYNMMDKVRKARTGSKKQGKQIKPAKYMPA